MKKILLTLLVAASVLKAEAQTPKWDSTYRPASYALK